MRSDTLEDNTNREKTEPLVNIVMAVYNPRMDWLKEQLQSLNQQTYSNIKITVRDDCSDKVSFEKIRECILEEITNFPVEVSRNDTNLGSNKAFELLTEKAEGAYIAYCDQDDIWLPEKIEKLVVFIEQTESQLVCSDVYIIDENSKITADSITQIRKRHIFKEGDKLTETLLFRNFVMGCTMLIRKDTGQEALPFISDMVHDHYLAFYASIKGAISVYKENLIKYRIHGQNQTNVLAGISSKQDYYEFRIKPYLKRIEQINERFDIPKAREALEWARARERYYIKTKDGLRTLLKLKQLDNKITGFELIMLRMPDMFFRIVLRKLQRSHVR